MGSKKGLVRLGHTERRIISGTEFLLVVIVAKLLELIQLSARS